MRIGGITMSKIDEDGHNLMLCEKNMSIKKPVVEGKSGLLASLDKKYGYKSNISKIFKLHQIKQCMWNISKKKLVIILIAVAVVAIKAQPIIFQLLEMAQKDVGDFIIYRNVDCGIYIKYPQDWKIEENKDIIKFFPPWEKYSDEFPERFVIQVTDYSYVRDLDAHVREHFWVLKDLIDKDLMDKVSIIEQNRITVDNYQAIKVVYTGIHTEEKVHYNLKVMYITVIKGKRVYEFSYWAEIDEYSDFLWVAELMVDSVDFIEE